MFKSLTVFSLSGSLLLTVIYLLGSLLAALLLGSFLGTLLFTFSLHKENPWTQKISKALDFFLAAILSFPFSFLFFILMFFIYSQHVAQVPLFFPLIPLALYCVIHFTRQVYQCFSSLTEKELEMAHAIGLSNKAIIFQILLPHLQQQLVLFSANSLLAILSPLIICGMVSGLGIGGHFYRSFVQTGNYGWVMDSFLLLIFVFFLLIIQKRCLKKKVL
ncbi:MAG: hypothetical protein GX786_00080 [Clostridiales bacterium]|nr:hypothetical protein [Clostridiales bacterium]